MPSSLLNQEEAETAETGMRGGEREGGVERESHFLKREGEIERGTHEREGGHTLLWPDIGREKKNGNVLHVAPSKLL